MKSIIDTVAELTYLRDRDSLENAFCRAILELAHARGLTLWRATSTQGGIVWRHRLGLPRPEFEPEDVAWPDAPDSWRECHVTQRFIKTPPAGPQAGRLVYPLGKSERIAGILELRCAAALSAQRERVLDGLVQIYLNHLALLDYGARDELTGLLNRRMLNEHFRQAVGTSAQKAAIAVIDIDFFKRINDQFGHPYGDEVLVLMARLIERQFARWEGLFRFGGEEFVILLSDVCRDEAFAVLEDFRQNVAAHKFPQVGQVTVSIGFSPIRAGDNSSTAFGRADQALYIAKHSGRNQVQCFDTLVSAGIVEESNPVSGEAEFF